jgi:CO/xanthine dehydrogenase FAD-binding subunit
MDLITVRDVRVPRTRDELVFGPGDRPLGGGTWLYSETQPGLTGLVDLMGLGWTPLTVTDAGLEIAATCTIAELVAFHPPEGWSAWPLVAQCANGLLAGFKIWNLATVGGNIALGLPAGAMTSLLVGLDGTALIWGPAGDREIAVKDLVIGNRKNSLNHGEVVRSLHIPLSSLTAPTGFRRIALSDLGRTGTLVTARVTPAGLAFAITGGTLRPHTGLDKLDPRAIDDWFTDAHGSADWRQAMSERFVDELTEELS